MNKYIQRDAIIKSNSENIILLKSNWRYYEILLSIDLKYTLKGIYQ